MSIQLDRETTQDFTQVASLEWLETNGIGGWASATVAGLHSRRYHGLLVAAEETGSRTVLLSRLDETLHIDGASWDLGCNQFPGTIAPQGYRHLASFHQGLFPVFEYEAGGVRLRKTVAAVHGENTTLVLYEILEASGPFVLSLRPFVAARDLHVLAEANQDLREETSFEEGLLRLQPYPDKPEVFLQVPGASFRAHPSWWRRFEYELDRRRGGDFLEDLWTPGLLGREMGPGDRLGIVVSTADPQGRDAFVLLDKERRRREKKAERPDRDEVLQTWIKEIESGKVPQKPRKARTAKAKAPTVVEVAAEPAPQPVVEEAPIKPKTRSKVKASPPSTRRPRKKE
jgi:glycogen debranching enzyme